MHIHIRCRWCCCMKDLNARNGLLKAAFRSPFTRARPTLSLTHMLLQNKLHQCSRCTCLAVRGGGGGGGRAHGVCSVTFASVCDVSRCFFACMFLCVPKSRPGRVSFRGENSCLYISRRIPLCESRNILVGVKRRNYGQYALIGGLGNNWIHYY